MFEKAAANAAMSGQQRGSYPGISMEGSTPTPLNIYHNVISNDPTEKDSGQIIAEGRRLDHLLGELSEEVVRLESVVGLILRPSSPTPPSTTATAMPSRSGIAEGLGDASRRVAQAIVHLQSIRERVDL